MTSVLGPCSGRGSGSGGPLCGGGEAFGETVGARELEKVTTARQHGDDGLGEAHVEPLAVKGAVLRQVRELVEFARRQGYRREGVIAMIEGMSL
jgi:hypothetical protein